MTRVSAEDSFLASFPSGPIGPGREPALLPPLAVSAHDGWWTDALHLLSPPPATHPLCAHCRHEETASAMCHGSRPRLPHSFTEQYVPPSHSLTRHSRSLWSAGVGAMPNCLAADQTLFWTSCCTSTARWVGRGHWVAQPGGRWGGVIGSHFSGHFPCISQGKYSSFRLNQKDPNPLLAVAKRRCYEKGEQ